MKLSFTLAFVILSVCLVSARKRIVRGHGNVDTENGFLFRARCPPSFSQDECLDYAQDESKKLKVCHTFEVERSGTLLFQFCPSVDCPRELVRQEQDLSQRYPLCCEQCLYV